MARTVVKAEWIIRSLQDKQIPVRDQAVVIENGRIADITADAPAHAEAIDIPDGIVVPGFLNLHNHTIKAPLFRGIVDDLPRRAIGESKVYSMLMPTGALAMTYLEDAELEALVALGPEIMKSGATTLVDQFRPRQRAIFDLARNGGCGSMAPPTSFLPRRRSRLRLSPPPRQSGTAAELVHAATIASADILRRPDPRPGSGPVPPPTLSLSLSMPCGRTCSRSAIRSERWCGMLPRPMSIRSSSRGAWSFALARVLGLDEAGIIAKGRAAITKLWNEAKRLGHFPPEAEPATAD